MIEYRHSVLPDIYKLAKDLRQADIDEVQAAVGESGQKALLHGYLLSKECFTIYEQDSPLAMFGYRIVDPGISAQVWMLAGNNLEKHKVRFLKRSAELVFFLNQKAPLLFNVVDLRNELHIRWLDWLGFKFVRVIPDFGAERRPFVEFVRLHGNPTE